jgi:hypothetical protein
MEDNDIPLDFLWEGFLKVMRLTLSTLRVANYSSNPDLLSQSSGGPGDRACLAEPQTWLGQTEVSKNAVTPHRKLFFKEDLQ